ncbi:immunity 49 family protein [Archangium violaceum]|uniref:immunity 49 family protein n=1 Tax=Archangium violaceum TaxID=83451 RepID=UPI00193BC0E1|nr:immunity 49 family protein [Archangium violaceum]QRK11327.1 immunity 49 family protein [Archangium violaceum]
MGLKKLELLIHSMESRLRDNLGRLSEDGPVPDLTLETCRLYRRIGCGVLLASHDTGTCRERLSESARMFLMFLRAHEPLSEVDDKTRYYLARGRGEFLLDALCAGDVALTREIDEALPAAWMPDSENEEDFLYLKLLPALTPGVGPESPPAEDTQRLARLLAELDTPRLKALDALLRNHERDFEDALEAVTSEWREGIESERDSGTVDPFHDRTEANVFLEGTALVRVARLRKIKTAEQYPFIPAALLRPPRSASSRRGAR